MDEITVTITPQKIRKYIGEWNNRYKLIHGNECIPDWVIERVTMSLYHKLERDEWSKQFPVLFYDSDNNIKLKTTKNKYKNVYDGQIIKHLGEYYKFKDGSFYKCKINDGEIKVDFENKIHERHLSIKEKYEVFDVRKRIEYHYE